MRKRRSSDARIMLIPTYYASLRALLKYHSFCAVMHHEICLRLSHWVLSGIICRENFIMDNWKKIIGKSKMPMKAVNVNALRKGLDKSHCQCLFVFVFVEAILDMCQYDIASSTWRLLLKIGLIQKMPDLLSVPGIPYMVAIYDDTRSNSLWLYFVSSAWLEN